MKILVVASDGATLGIAQGLVREGHEVDVFPLDMSLIHTGNEIYDITTNLWKAVQECKFIVADRGWDRLYVRAKSYNKPIIGAHPMTDVLNVDSVKEYALGQKLGIKYPETEIFNDFADLQPKIMSGKYRRYYVKTDRKTFVCTAPEWLAWAMYQLPVGKDVLLQEEVKGEELSIVGWFNGLNWVRPFFYSTPRAQASKAVAMLAEKKLNPLVERTIFNLQFWLKKIDYKGPVTVDLIANKTDFWTRKIYAGITSPSLFAMMEGLKDIPISSFLNQLAFGSDDKVNVSYDYLLGLEVSSQEQDMYGAPILGVDEGNSNKIFLHGAYGTGTDIMMSGEVEPIYTAVAHGRDLDEASKRIYRTIDKVKFPRMRYVSNLRGISNMTFNNLKSWKVL
jgi:phosphoribosylamine-glycine ligase